MKLKISELSRHIGLASVAVVCALAAVSCTKKNDDKPVVEEDTVVVTEQPADTVEEVNTVAIDCNDDIALKKLNQTLRASLSTQTDRLLSTYSNRAGANMNMASVNSLVDSILIDIATPNEIQPVNNMGMVTCQANLSMTLPNNDMNRAKEVYKSLGGSSLNQTLASQNITANNNMLVSKNFSYVVGMQGGQTTAKLVGEPEIVSAVADIAAKSKLKATLDANQPAVRTRPKVERPAPAEVVRPKPVVPSPTPEPVQIPEPMPTPEQTSPQGVESTVPTKPSEALPSAPQAPALSKDNSGFSVPEDENIEMVIIEEEGTY